MIAFKSLPLVVRIATIATFFLAWLLFEELVIDRYGLNVYLPFYRVAEGCIWDVAALALCALAWWRLHR